MKSFIGITKVRKLNLMITSFLFLIFAFCEFIYADESQGRQVKSYNEISFGKAEKCKHMKDSGPDYSVCTKCGLICDHEVVLDKDGRLLPWTSYNNIINWSMNFIKNCPTIPTKFGDDPWYLVTSAINKDGTFRRNQNNMGSNVYWAVETLKKYYAYTGDREPFYAVRLILDRVIDYDTPSDWAWPNVPRTQDDSPDGEYTDQYSEGDKMCMAALGYLNFYKLTGEKKYLDEAMSVTRTVMQHLTVGDEQHSPLPFRVDLKTGEVLDPYTADMVYALMLLDELATMDDKVEGRKYYGGGGGVYRLKRRILQKWIFDYPMKNNIWSGYYEDVSSDRDCKPKGHEYDLGGGYYNLNQQLPMETAKYILQNPKLDRDYKKHIPALIKWVEERFGATKRYGATSVKEQDQCFLEMSSHTPRYASVVAKWFGVTGDPNDREEALKSFALATYSAYNRYSKDGIAINYVGLAYESPWFSDCYFDYILHFINGMAELPEMAPDDEDHILGSDSAIRWVRYLPKQIEYKTYEPYGSEILRLTFEPKVFDGDGKELDKSKWSFGEYRGVPNVLRITRKDVKHIVIKGK